MPVQMYERMQHHNTRLWAHIKEELTRSIAKSVCEAAATKRPRHRDVD